MTFFNYKTAGKSTLDTALIFFLLLCSGNPALPLLFGKELFVFLPLIALIPLLFMRSLKPRRNDFFIFIFFILVSIIHFLEFGAVIYRAVGSTIVNIIVALIAVRCIKDTENCYIAVMKRLVLVSFFFFIPETLGLPISRMFPSISSDYLTDTIHIGIHNFGREDWGQRNAGFFWEPGAFAGYIILGLLFLIGEQIKNGGRIKLNYEFLILTAGLITTFSTTGYVAFLLICVHFLLHNYGLKKAAPFVLFAIILFSGAYIGFKNFSFLSEKINVQYEETIELRDGYESTRFGNFLYDLSSIRERPMLGWSPYVSTRIKMDSEVTDIAAAQGNGLTGFAVKYGLIGMLICGWFVFSGLKTRYSNKLFSLIFMATVGTLLLGEQFFNYPIFLMLFFQNNLIKFWAHKKQN